MPETLEPDLCVIGAGSGGLSVAAAAASMGVPVALVEKGEMGGDCLNYGCVPSKALIAAAHAAHDMRHAGRFGVASVEPVVDFAAVLAHVRGVIDAIAPNDSVARFTAMGVRVIRAHGRFLDKNRLEAGDVVVKARRFIVATGSSPAVPPIPGLEQTRFLTNETLFDLESLPERLVVIGGGPIGLEMAQAFRRLGSAVTVLEGGRALGKEDPELAAPALDALARDGVALREGVKILRVDNAAGGGVRVALEGGETLDATHLLVATGRKANVHNLGLEQAGVDFDDRGLKVDARLRSSNKRIYAVGDVAGGAQFTHAANYHAGLVLRATLFRLWASVRPELIPRVTFLDPEIAVAGLTEAQARESHKRVLVYRWPFAENDRAQTERRTEGLVKAVVAPNGRILGVGVVGARAGELLAPWQLALTKGMKIGDMASPVLPYPTFSEVSKRAAITHYARQAQRPTVQSVLRFLRKFG